MRLFIAAWPSEEVIGLLRELPRKDHRGVRFVPPERWHVTLRFLGDVDLDTVVTSLDGFGETAPVARLGPGVDLLGERSLVVPVTGLDRLAQAVIARTSHLGEPPARRFVGHLTLARLRPGAKMPPALGMFVSGEFAVTEVCLVASRLRPGGAEYDTISAWPLAVDARGSAR